jgi:hypothetical protein
MSPEERQQARERIRNATPEQRQRMRERLHNQLQDR